MAGRINRESHRGAPKRLGPPAEGILRRVTIGEATAADISRGCLVCMLTSCIDLWVPRRLGRYHGGWVHLDKDDDEVLALEEYWRRK